MSDQEHAIAVARVSTLKQREEDQRPGLRKYVNGKGYELDAMIEIHGQSAFRGKHLKQLHKAVDDYVSNGEATVVVLRDVDRSSRQGVYEGYRLILKIMDAGARVEFAAPDQQFLNDQPEMLGIYFKMAQAESEVKRERRLQGMTVKREKGELNGRVPWGYDPVFDASGKIRINITPNELGRRWVKVIYESVVDGKSLRTIQTMLRGVPSPQRNGVWNEATIRRLIERPTYYGGRVGRGNMEYEALISYELWRQANDAIKARAKLGRSTTKLPPTLARPICGACYGIMREGAAKNVKNEDGTSTLVPDGRSPMYRTSHFGHDYYACKGHGPVRKGCGTKVIPIPLLDKEINRVMATQQRPHYEKVWIPGDDRAQQLADIDAEINAAMSGNHYELLTGLSEKAADIIRQPIRKARIGKRPSGMTVGQHWETLDLDGKRDELTNWEIIAYPDGRVRITGPWQDVPDDFDPDNPPIP